MTTRREFLRVGATGGVGLYVSSRFGFSPALVAQVPGGTLPPDIIPQFVTALTIPPAMPRTSAGAGVDYYRIAVRQFQQQILPGVFPRTPVWSYGSIGHPGSFNYPSFTIEARWKRAVRVKWMNELVDANGDYLPHLLPIDQTLHWANPPGGAMGRDMAGTESGRYLGPVPIVTHLHGGRTEDHSDGYAEAWYLPAARNVPSGYATVGGWYDFFRAKYAASRGLVWEPGSATYEYGNVQRATTLWFHDHSLGMTRANVYAGPAGFYLLRGGPGDDIVGQLPGPAPAAGDSAGMSYYEIPIVVQDRSFNEDGSLFYPDNRAFFEGLKENKLQIPFIPEAGCTGPSDVSPIWNPEFFGNVMVVNGASWPYLKVEKRRYRFRFLNGCNSRFLILKLDRDGLPFWQIGADGGFLPQAARLDRLLLGPAERADVIVDFSQVPVGTSILVQNIGPDEPFGGGEPGIDFAPSDPNTTGRVMLLRVVSSSSVDLSTPAADLVLPQRAALGEPSVVRQLSLNEEESGTVQVISRAGGMIQLACDDPAAAPFGPTAAKLGTLNADGSGNGLKWRDAITENPAPGTTEVWEIHNFTADAHPIHVHLVMFEVLERQNAETGEVRAAEPWETGTKDTVISYPGEITRVKAKFDLAGQYVWHCHILEHEDNEMMRPYSVGPVQTPST
jgi:FtsP/CotA-like multicopper oxidase with cupredoxin domain